MDRHDNPEPAEAEEKRRLYSQGAMAQSYVPQGVAGLLNRKRALERQQFRAQWQKLQSGPRSRRLAYYVVAGTYATYFAALAWAFVTDDGSLIAALLLAFLGISFVILALGIAVEVRGQSRAKRAR